MSATVAKLNREEERELSLERTKQWLKDGTVTPFTPAEARFHAEAFIASNGRNNLVSLLAKAFIELQDGAS